MNHIVIYMIYGIVNLDGRLQNVLSKWGGLQKVWSLRVVM